jgi:hypothetical protein
MDGGSIHSDRGARAAGNAIELWRSVGEIKPAGDCVGRFEGREAQWRLR